jgi:hypothetical protein
MQIRVFKHAYEDLKVGDQVFLLVRQLYRIVIFKDVVFFFRWDLTSHVKTAHRGEKVACPHCGSCFSKKSNLHNHLKRGKGCPR